MEGLVPHYQSRTDGHTMVSPKRSDRFWLHSRCTKMDSRGRCQARQFGLVLALGVGNGQRQKAREIEQRAAQQEEREKASSSGIQQDLPLNKET